MKIKSVLLMSLMVLFLVGCSKTKKNEPVVVNSSIETIASKNKKTAQRETTSAEIEELSQESKVEQITSSLNQGMAVFFDISFDEALKTFKLIPKEESQIGQNFARVSESPEEANNSETIKEMAMSLRGFSTSVADSLGKNYHIELINPFTTEGSFFVITDGIITYPILK